MSAPRSRTGWAGGYAHYRVVVTTDSPTESRIGVEQVTLAPAGRPAYRNPDRVVHLYDYLTARLTRPAVRPEEVSVPLMHPDAPPARAHVVGPIVVGGLSPEQHFGLRVLDPGTYVVDGLGDPVFGPLTGAEPVFLRLRLHRPVSSARMAVTLPGSGSLEPHVLLGAEAPGAAPRFTPVVRLVPTNRQADAMFLMDVTERPDRIQHID